MLTNLKRRTALLLTAAVLCSVTALAPTTAGAAPSKVPNLGISGDPHTAPADLETLSACPGTTAPAAGFTDTTSTDVDCIKMFGITTGATATTYEPAGTIPRWQMALFIHRMFVPTSLAAAGTTTVPAFTDLGGLSAETVAAIEALASHGITLGTSTTEFSPDALVTREQMALFLNRYANKVRDHNQATLLTNQETIGDGTYNYTDIAQTSFEAMESIIRLYNLGVTDGTCTVVSNVGCVTTYRPTENITRAEMATMVARLLNHTNARPAGTTIQAYEGLVTAGAKTVSISVRNADFTPQLNTLVDHFYDPTQLTTSRALSANAPFTAVLGTVSASVTSGQGTAGTIDPLDLPTSAYGNVDGTGLTTAANSTTSWWAWTGTTGDIYVDGTTSTGYLLEAVMGAASTTVYGDTTTYAVSGANALGEALAADFSGLSSLLADDGITTIAGGSRTLTATMSNAALTAAGTAHTVVDGYTFKFAHTKVDMLGNVTITNTYVPSVNGVASYTVTCGADNSALTTGAGNANASYWEGHEVVVSSATAAGTGAGVSWPTAGTNPYGNAAVFPTDGGDSGSLNVSCDDDTRAYVAGTTGNTLTIGTNTVVASTAGTLVAVSSKAFDQYGDGIAGVTSRFDKAQMAATGNLGAATQQAILTSGANGVSTLNAVLCSASFNGSEEFSINTTGAVMSNINATAAGALTVEGTTVYCAAAGLDAAVGTVTAATEVQTLILSAAFAAGDFLCTYSGQTTGVLAGDITAGDLATALNGLNNLSGVSAALAAETYTVTFAAGTGNHSAIACDGTAGVALTEVGGDPITIATVSDGSSGATTDGVAGVTLQFIDDDPSANTILTQRTVTDGTGTDGASVATRTNTQWTYDATDVFNLDSADGEVDTTVLGASEAQFEAESASLTGLAGATPMSLSYRIGALTTGISVFKIGAGA